MISEDRYTELLNILRSLPAAAVALSGGVDSSLLLAAAAEALPGRVYAVTAKAPYMHKKDLDLASRTVRQLCIPHIILPLPGVPDEILANPEDRCYRCKRFLFRKIIEKVSEDASEADMGPEATAPDLPAPRVLDGMNADETAEYRPGTRALEELEIESPLAAAGLTKKDIRYLAKKKGLPSAGAPSGSCLLTRFPYGTHIHESQLERVAEAEEFLTAAGFTMLRVRVHEGGDLARIEVGNEELTQFFNGSVGLDRLRRRFHELGFKYITLDIEGFRSGSMD